MTRFLLSLDQAVDLIFSAVRSAKNGETYVPLVPSARVDDIANLLVAGRDIPIKVTGVRPGEKLHEVLISEEEAHRTTQRAGHLVIRNILPEFASGEPGDVPWTGNEYSSGDLVMSREEVARLFSQHDITAERHDHHRMEMFR
jgi:UDP-glucose 4-epimerase